MPWTIYAGEAVLGFAGALVYGLQRLTSALCGGDEQPSAAARRRAWAEFVNTLLLGPLFAGAFSSWVVDLSAKTGRHPPWPAVAVTIGLFGTLILKDLPGLLWPRLKLAWEALTQGSKP